MILQGYKYVSLSLWPWLTFFRLKITCAYWNQVGRDWERLSCHGNKIFMAVGEFSIELLVYQVSMVCAANRPFAGSSHMVQNKLCWDPNDAVGFWKQRKVGLDLYEFLCFRSPTALFVSQRNLFRTMWLDPARGLLAKIASSIYIHDIILGWVYDIISHLIYIF